MTAPVLRAGTPRRRDERGSVAAELVLLTPILILMLLFVVALGRLAGAASTSMARPPRRPVPPPLPGPGYSDRRGPADAAAALGSDHVTCAQLDVSTDTTQIRPRRFGRGDRHLQRRVRT